MAESERSVLFSHETLLIGMLQVVSGVAIVATVAETDTITDLVGFDIYCVLVTAMVLALLAALWAAYFRHRAKRAGASEDAVPEVERGHPAQRSQRTVRALILIALLAINLGLIAFIGALWVSAPPPSDDDSSEPAAQSLKV
jgi:hypothetical protein